MSKPAFPRPYSEWHEEGIKHELPQQQGMSLLEFYAGQAFKAVLLSDNQYEACKGISKKEYRKVGEVIATASFEYAKHMVKEAEKRSQ